MSRHPPAYIDRLGPASVIRIGRLPDPRSDRDTCASASTLWRSTRSTPTSAPAGNPTAMTFPFVIGRDLVGQIVEVADDVTEFSAGEAA